jgi:hypothetical protein
MFLPNATVLMPIIPKKLTWKQPIAPRHTYRTIRLPYRNPIRVHTHPSTNVSSSQVENVGEATGECQAEEEDSEHSLIYASASAG